MLAWLSRGARSLVLVACLAGFGCQRSGAEDPDQVARLDRSIEALRDAPNGEKAPYLDELRSQKCPSPRYCELKRVCTRAYSDHLEALERVQEIRGNGAKAPDSLRKLEAAKQALLAAEKLAQRCVTLQAELREQKPGG